MRLKAMSRARWSAFWRRALLAPIRLVSLIVTMLLVLLVISVSAIQASAMIKAQEQASRFAGQSGWRITVSPSEEVGPSTSLGLVPELNHHSLRHPAIWFAGRSTQVRTPDVSESHLAGVAFANAESGLAQSSIDGEAPCVWLGLGDSADTEWIVNHRLRCTRVKSPSTWRGLGDEIGGETLVLPLSYATMAAGPQWERKIDLILVGAVSPCSELGESIGPTVSCERFASTRSSQSEVAAQVGHWQKYLLPAALSATLAALLVYLYGLYPILQLEFVLRLSLGVPEHRLVIWLATSVFLYFALLISILIAAALALHAWFSVPWGQWQKACWLTFIGGGSLVGVVSAVASALVQKDSGLSRLSAT